MRQVGLEALCEHCGEKIVLQHILERHRFGGSTEIWVHSGHGWRPCYVNLMDGEPVEVSGSPTARPAGRP